MAKPSFVVLVESAVALFAAVMRSLCPPEERLRISERRRATLLSASYNHLHSGRLQPREPASR